MKLVVSRYIHILIFFFCASIVFAQEGNQYITNFSPSTYKASDQNWSSIQDKNGVMYFANLNGVLIYNGRDWQTIQLPHEENVTSLSLNSHNQVFIGAENEFGYLTQNKNGKFIYESLSDSVLKAKHDFSIIWATHCIDEDVFFCSNEKIFRYKNQKITAFDPEKDRFHTFFNIDNHLFVREFGVGFKIFENDDLHFVLGSEIFADKKIYSIMPINGSNYFVASRDAGMYYLHLNEKHPSQSTFSKAGVAIDDWLLTNELYCGRKITNNSFALGSLKNGLIIIDSTLKIISKINSTNGLQEDAVKHISLDANSNLWLSLNKGISYYEKSTPITYFGKQDGIDGIINNSIRYKNQLYISTDKGLKQFDNNSRKFIETDVNSSCWVISKSNDLLFISSDEGTYEYNGKVFKLINDESSYSCAFNFVNNQLYIGTDNALLVLNSKYEVQSRFDDIGSVRSIAFDKNGICVLGTSKNGVYVLDKQYHLKNIGIKEGLPSLAETNVFGFDGQLFLTTDVGFYGFNDNFTSVLKPKQFNAKNGWVVNHAVQIDKQIWFQSSVKDKIKVRVEEISVFEKNNNEFNLVKTYLSRIQNADVKHFLQDSGHIFISTNQGLYSYELNKYQSPNKFNVVLSKINFEGDTIHSFENFTSDFNYQAFSVSYINNELQIIPSATSFYESHKIEYSYYLEGKETAFKDYAAVQSIEYNNLHENDYVFHIKAKDIFGNETEELTFRFTVSPPWYRSVLSYIIYVILLIVTIYVIIKIYTKRLIQQNIQLENIISERTKTIVNQNSELEHKNKEITDSINYAQRIQKSLLASDNLLNRNLKNYFVFFQPKDIVSGDFYWGAELDSDKFALVTADSTGHGVPGAIMSMLNISCLNEAIEGQKLKQPKDILNYTRHKIIKHLSNDGSESGGKDGMDCSLICFDLKNNQLTYSAANNPIWIVRDNVIIELKPDKMPVGKHDRDSESFTEHVFDLQKNDMVYTLTDGMPDQFGGPKGKKFMYKQLKELLVSLSKLPMNEQKEQLNTSFNDWKTDMEQVDDVLLIGVRV